MNSTELDWSEIERNTLLFAVRYLQQNIDSALTSPILDGCVNGQPQYCEGGLLIGVAALDELAEKVKEL